MEIPVSRKVTTYHKEVTVKCEGELGEMGMYTSLGIDRNCEPDRFDKKTHVDIALLILGGHCPGEFRLHGFTEQEEKFIRKRLLQRINSDGIREAKLIGAI
jgi:hypothetical protein